MGLDTLDDDQWPRGGFKVGGWPACHQGDQYPACLDTRLPCEYLLQIPSHQWLTTDFAGKQGTAWVFESVTGRRTMTWQGRSACAPQGAHSASGCRQRAE